MNITRLNGVKDIIIERGSGGNSGGSGKFQNKKVTLEKALTTINPDVGYDALSTVFVTVPLEDKSIQLNSPEEVEIVPETLGFKKVIISTSLQEKTSQLIMTDISEDIEIHVDEGFVGMSKFTIRCRTVSDYLTFEALEDGLQVRLDDTAMEYSIDGSSEWIRIDKNTLTPPINNGQTISFKANGVPKSNYGIGTFSATHQCNISGNVMSLLYGDDAYGRTSISDKSYAFMVLFKNCKKIISASKLLLPATTLAYKCYQSMFEGCTYLRYAPEILPATTATITCYQSMFSGCSNLISAPKILLTTMVDYSCRYMFYNCSSLTKAPDLPATTLATECYSDMFNGCTSLREAPDILPATTLANRCYAYMFRGCTYLKNAPELPAINLKDGCYENMFWGCARLSYIKALFQTEPSNTYTNHWVYDVELTGTFVKSADATWDVTGVSGIPEGWTVEYANA